METLNENQIGNSRAREDIKDLLAEQIAADMERWCAAQGLAKKEGFRKISSATGISIRSLERYFYNGKCPSPNAAIEIYKVIFSSCKSKAEFEKALPEVALEYFKGRASWTELSFSKVISEQEFELKMKESEIFRDIWVSAAQSNHKFPLTTEYITYNFGRKGLEVLDEMVQYEILTVEGNIVSLILENSPNWSPGLIHSMGATYAREKVFSNKMTEQGENLANFWVAGVNEETFNKMLNNLEDAINKNMELTLIPENKGEIKCFQTVFMDTGSKNTIKQAFRSNRAFAKNNLGDLQ